MPTNTGFDPKNINDTSTPVLGTDPVDKTTGLNVNSIVPKQSKNIGFNIKDLEPVHTGYTGGQEFKTDITPYEGYIKNIHPEFEEPYLEEQRAQNQEPFEKIGHGLIKGLVTVGTVSTDGIFGTVAGLANLAGGESYIDNPITNYLNNINKKLDETLPNYYTEEEKNKGILGQLGTTNFWADKILKNIGMIEGTILAGIVTGGVASEALGMKALAAKIPEAIAAVELSEDNVLGLATQAKNGIKLTDEVIKNASKLKNMGVLNQALSSTISSQGMAKMGAIDDSKEFYDKHKQILDEQLVNGTITSNEYQSKLEKLDDAKKGMMNVDFLVQSVIMGVSSASMYRNLFTKGFTTSTKLAEGIKGGIEEGYKVTQQLLPKLAKTVKAPVIDQLMFQGFYAGTEATNDYYDRKFDNEYVNKLDNLIKSSYKGLTDAFGTTEGWKQGIMGTLMSFIGVPGIERNPASGKASIISSALPEGAFWKDLREAREDQEFNKEAVDHLNEVIKSPDFKNHYDHAIRSLSLEKDKLEAARDNDKFEVLNKQHDQFVNDALAFIKAKRYDDLVDHIKGIKNAGITELREMFKSDPSGDIFRDMTDGEIKQHLNDNSNDMLRDLKKIKDMYGAYSVQYPNMNEEVKEKLIHYSSTIDDLNNRIKDINSNMFKKLGINPEDFIDIKSGEKGFTSDNVNLIKAVNDIKNKKFEEGELTISERNTIDRDLADLSKVLLKKAVYVNYYKTLTTGEGLQKYIDRVDEEHKEQEEANKSEKTPYIPKPQDNVYDEDGNRYNVKDVDEQGQYHLIPIDENNKPISEEEIIKPLDSLTLESSKTNSKDNNNIEPLDNREWPELNQSMTGSQSSNTISYGNLEGNKYKSRNQEYDDYLSNPKNDLKEDKIKFDIDYNYNKPEDKKRQLHLDKINKLKKDGSLSEEQVDKLLDTVETINGEDNYNSLVDNLPITIEHQTKDGRVFKEGLYYHDSSYADINHLTIDKDKIDNSLLDKGITPDLPDYKNLYQQEIAKQIIVERQSQRKNRRAILREILLGKEVSITHINKSKGIPNTTSGNELIHTILGIGHNDVRLYIAGGDDKLYPTTELYQTGHAGNVYISTNETCNGEKGLVKLNPSKISKQHANILWNAFHQMYSYGSSFHKTVYQNPEGTKPKDEVTGQLTVREVIDLLALEGPITNLEHPIHEGRDVSHLANKQLFVDENGLLNFGQNKVSLRGDLSDFIARKDEFISWVTKNKNYVISKSIFDGDLNDPMIKEFKIGDWISEGKDTYSGSLVKHGMIKTDLKRDEKTNSLFRSPVVSPDLTSSSLDIKESKKIIEDRIQQVKSVEKRVEPLKEVKSESKPIIKKEEIPTEKVKIEVGKERINIKDKRNNLLISKEDIQNLPIGSIIQQVNLTRDPESDSKEYTESIKQGVRVIDRGGKKYFELSPVVKVRFGENFEESEVEVNDENTNIILKYLEYNYTYIDTSKAIDKPTEVKDIEPQIIKRLPEGSTPLKEVEKEESNSKDIEGGNPLDISFGEVGFNDIPFRNIEEGIKQLSSKGMPISKSVQGPKIFLFTTLITNAINNIVPKKYEFDYMGNKLHTIKTVKQLRDVTKAITSLVMSPVSKKLLIPSTSEFAIIEVKDAVKNINENVGKLKDHIKNHIDNLERNLASNSNNLVLIRDGKATSDDLKNMSQIYKSSDPKVILSIIPNYIDTAKHLRDLWTEVFDNYDNLFKEKVLDHLYDTLNLKHKEDSDEDTSNKELTNYDKESFETNSKDNIHSSIKFLLANLPESNTPDPLTGVTTFANPDLVWGRLMADFHNTGDINNIIDILDKSDFLPYKVLSVYLKKGSPLLRTQFQVSVNKYRHQFTNALYEGDLEKGFRITFNSADLVSTSNTLRNEWGQLLSLSELGKDNKLDPSKIKSINNEYKVFSNSVTNKVKDGVDISPFKDKLVNLLNKLSIGIDSNTIDKMINDKLKDKSAGTSELAFRSIVTDIENGLFSETSTIYKYTTDHKDILNDKNLRVTNIFRREGITDKLATAYAQANNQDVQSIIIGADHNFKFAYSDPTYLADTINELKLEENIDKLLADPYTSSSRWGKQLKSMGPQQRQDFCLHTFNMFIQPNSGDAGKEYLDMSPIEDFLLKMSANDKNHLTLPTLADRKTYGTIEGLNKIDAKYISENGKLVFPKAVIDQFYNYMKSEFTRIETQTKFLSDHTNEDGRVDFSALLDNYHHINGDVKIGNAYRYNLFPELDPTFNPIKEEEKAKDHINKILEYHTNKTIEMANRLGIITTDNGKITSNNLISNEIVDELKKEYGGDLNAAVRSLFSDYTVNTMINGIETEMLFMVDRAFFKYDKDDKNTLDDYTKRISLLMSSGAIGIKGKKFNRTSFSMGSLANPQVESEYLDQLINKHIELLKPRYPETSEKDLRNLVEKNLYAYKSNKSDPTDAQVYISPIMFRELMNREGNWSDNHEKAFNLLNSTEEITPEQEQELLGFSMNILKHAYYDKNPLIADNPTQVPLCLKMSMAPIFRRYASGTHMEDVLDRMEGKGQYTDAPKIDMIAFKSAIKVGGKRSIDLFKNPHTDKQKLNNLSRLHLQDLNFNKLRHQVITDPHDTQEVSLKSQSKKIGLSDIEDNSSYNINGKDYSGKEVKNNINNALSELSEKGKKVFLNKMQVDQNGRLNDEKFFQTLYEEVKLAGMNDNILDSLRVGLPIDNLAERNWIHQRFVAAIKKSNIDFQMPGNQLIQMSGYGFSSKSSKFTNDLKFIFDKDKIKGLESKLSVQIFKKLIPDYKNKTFDQKVEWLNQNKDVLEGLGYRIPTQGQNSMIPITVKEFLPEELGDTIMMPNEFTALTGSDFDIDKLYFNTYNYKLDKKGNVFKYEFSDGNSKNDINKRYDNALTEAFYRYSSDIFDTDSYRYFNEVKQQYYDSLADKYDLLGEDGTRIKEMIQSRKPLSTMIDIAKKNKDDNALDLYTREMMKIDSKIDDFNFNNNLIRDLNEDFSNVKEDIKNILVDKGVLPSLEEFSKLPIIKQNTEKAIQNHLLDHYRDILRSNNNFLQATTPLDVQTATLKDLAKEVMNLDKINKISEEGSTDLAFVTPTHESEVKYKFTSGKDGVGAAALNNVSHIMCQVADINYRGYYGVGYEIGKGNTNLHEIYSKDGVRISDYLSALVSLHVDIAKDTSIIDLNVVKRTYNSTYFLLRSGEGMKTFEFIPQPIIKELVDKSLLLDSDITDSTDSPMFRKSNIERDLKEKWKKLTTTDDLASLENYNPFEDDLHKILVTKDEDKNSIWYAKQYKILEKFFELDKVGKDLNELVMATRADTGKTGKNPNEIKLYQDSVDRLISKDKFENLSKLISMNEDDESSFLSTYHRNSIGLTNKLLQDKTITATKGFNNLVDRVLKLIKKEGYADKEDINTISNEIYSAFMGKFFSDKLGLSPSKVRDICNDVIQTLKKVQNGQFKDLEDNELVKSLIKGMTIEPSSSFPGFVGIPSVKAESNFVKDDFTYAWQNMMNSEDPNIYKFAIELMIYSYYVSGFNQRVFSLHNFIPVQLKLISKMGEYTKDLIGQLNDQGNIPTSIEGIDKEILLNNYTNNLFVPQIRNNKTIINIHYSKSDKPQLGIISKNSYIIGKNQNGDSVYKPYVHYIKEEGKSYLMEFIGVTSHDSAIYSLVDKKGYRNKGRTIKEYGLKDSILSHNIEADKLSNSQIMEVFRIDNSYKGSKFLSEEDRVPYTTVDDDKITSPLNDIQVDDTNIPSEDRSSNLASENALKTTVVNLNGVKSVKEAEVEGEGINVLRKYNTNEHYGNPFSHLSPDKTGGKTIKTKTVKEATIKTKTVKEAADNYRDWLNGSKYQNVEPERRKWIIKQIDEGKLDGKKLLYYTQLSEPSHADRLAEFVNNRTNMNIDDKSFIDLDKTKSDFRSEVGNNKELLDMIDKAKDAKDFNEINKRICEEGISSSSIKTINNKNKYSAKDEL